MPENKKYNGGIDGQSARKRPERTTSTSATQGIRGSTRQGMGAQGLANQAPSDVVDSSKMSPEEKLKYFKSLGLVKNLTK